MVSIIAFKFELAVFSANRSQKIHATIIPSWVGCMSCQELAVEGAIGLSPNRMTSSTQDRDHLKALNCCHLYFLMPICFLYMESIHDE